MVIKPRVQRRPLAWLGLGGGRRDPFLQIMIVIMIMIILASIGIIIITLCAVIFLNYCYYC